MSRESQPSKVAKTAAKAILLAFTLAPILGDGAVGQPGNPLPTDWVISDYQKLEDRDVTVKGNIVIRANGVLDVARTTIRLEQPPPLEPTILVEAGGLLLLNGSVDRHTILTDGALDEEGGVFPPYTDYHYRIHVEAGGSLVGRDCEIVDAGVNQWHRQGPTALRYNDGLRIRGAMDLRDCTIRETIGGIRAERARIQLEDVTMTDNWGQDLQAFGGTVVMRNSSFTGNFLFVGLETFNVTDVAFKAEGNAYQNGITDNANGVLTRVSFAGYYRCMNFGRSRGVYMRDVAFVGCGTGMSLIDSDVRGDHVTVQDSRTMGFAASVMLESSNIELENSSILPGAAPDMRIMGPSTAQLRNVTWQRHVAFDGEGAVEIVGLASVRVGTADGRAVGSVDVEATNERLGVTLRNTTREDGNATFWLPVATVRPGGPTHYDRNWSVRLVYQPSVSQFLEAKPGHVHVELQAERPEGNEVPSAHTLLIAALAVAAFSWWRGRTKN